MKICIILFMVITFLLAYYRLPVEGKTEENMEKKEKNMRENDEG